MNVPTKELKNRLSYFLRRVRRGETLLVTDRGRVVAEVRPVEATVGGDPTERLLALETEGVLTLGRSQPRDFAPIRPRKAVKASRLILADRR